MRIHTMPIEPRSLTLVTLILNLVLAGILAWVFWDQIVELWYDAEYSPTVCVVDEGGVKSLTTCSRDAVLAE